MNACFDINHTVATTINSSYRDLAHREYWNTCNIFFNDAKEVDCSKQPWLFANYAMNAMAKFDDDGEFTEDRIGIFKPLGLPSTLFKVQPLASFLEGRKGDVVSVSYELGNNGVFVLKESVEHVGASDTDLIQFYDSLERGLGKQHIFEAERVKDLLSRAYEQLTRHEYHGSCVPDIDVDGEHGTFYELSAITNPSEYFLGGNNRSAEIVGPSLILPARITTGGLYSIHALAPGSYGYRIWLIYNHEKMAPRQLYEKINGTISKSVCSETDNSDRETDWLELGNMLPSPLILQAEGIQTNIYVQRPGEFVVLPSFSVYSTFDTGKGLIFSMLLLPPVENIATVLDSHLDQHTSRLKQPVQRVHYRNSFSISRYSEPDIRSFYVAFQKRCRDIKTDIVVDYKPILEMSIEERVEQARRLWLWVRLDPFQELYGLIVGPLKSDMSITVQHALGNNLETVDARDIVWLSGEYTNNQRSATITNENYASRINVNEKGRVYRRWMQADENFCVTRDGLSVVSKHTTLPDIGRKDANFEHSKGLVIPTENGIDSLSSTQCHGTQNYSTPSPVKQATSHIIKSSSFQTKKLTPVEPHPVQTSELTRTTPTSQTSAEVFSNRASYDGLSPPTSQDNNMTSDQQEQINALDLSNGASVIGTSVNCLGYPQHASTTPTQYGEPSALLSETMQISTTARSSSHSSPVKAGASLGRIVPTVKNNRKRRRIARDPSNSIYGDDSKSASSSATISPVSMSTNSTIIADLATNDIPMPRASSVIDTGENLATTISADQPFVDTTSQSTMNSSDKTVAETTAFLFATLQGKIGKDSTLEECRKAMTKCFEFVYRPINMEYTSCGHSIEHHVMQSFSKECNTEQFEPQTPDEEHCCVWFSGFSNLCNELCVYQVSMLCGQIEEDNGVKSVVFYDKYLREKNKLVAGESKVAPGCGYIILNFASAGKARAMDRLSFMHCGRRVLFISFWEAVDGKSASNSTWDLIRNCKDGDPFSKAYKLIYSEKRARDDVDYILSSSIEI